MNETNHRDCPAEVLDWIAWYPEHNVPERIRHLIESHAAECLACRSEISALTDAASEPGPAVPDPEALWRRVLAQIEEPEERRPDPALPEVRRRPPGRRRTIWAASRRSAVAAGLALTLSAGLIGATAARLGAGPSTAQYETVTEPQPAVPGDVVQLDVVFRPEVPFGQIQQALMKAGGTLVNGPSRGGVLRLILPAGSDAKRVAEQLRDGPEAVALFAEPVAS
jgi:hypothetical protein